MPRTGMRLPLIFGVRRASPVVINNQPALASFLRRDTAGYVVIVHEAGTVSAPWGGEDSDPDGYAVMSLTSISLVSPEGRAVATVSLIGADMSYTEAVYAAGQAAYNNEG